MKYLRRMMSFLAIRLAILTVCLSILVCAFYLTFNLGNAAMIISEGFEKRMEVILTREDAVSLNNYFAAECLNVDSALNWAFSPSSTYLAYTVTSFEHDVKLESIWGWPWSNTILCEVAEYNKSVTGTRKAAYAEVVDAVPSPWISGRYKIKLSKQSDGQWKIVSIGQIGTFPQEN